MLPVQRETLYDALTAAGARFSFAPRDRTYVRILVDRERANLEIVEAVLGRVHDPDWRGLVEELWSGDATFIGRYAVAVQVV
jgi:hypothetical protein